MTDLDSLIVILEFPKGKLVFMLLNGIYQNHLILVIHIYKHYLVFIVSLIHTYTNVNKHKHCVYVKTEIEKKRKDR